MANRKVPLVTDEFYHIYTRSIAYFRIFRSSADYKRIIETIRFYTAQKPPYKFSQYLELLDQSKKEKLQQINNRDKLVHVIAYCIMPTHIHLVLRQMQDGGISKYANLILKSYSKYFNIKYNRLGPLWEGRFKNILVESDEQLLHLTRYIHLNPVSISLVSKAADWEFSSYKEYLGLMNEENSICKFSDCLDISVSEYKTFVDERIEYQRELETIKHLLLE